MAGGRKSDGFRRVIRALMGPYGPRDRLFAIKVAAEKYERAFEQDLPVAQERDDRPDRGGEPA